MVGQYSVSISVISRVYNGLGRVSNFTRSNALHLIKSAPCVVKVEGALFVTRARIVFHVKMARGEKAVYGEIGCLPLSISRKLCVVKYWLRFEVFQYI